MSLAIIKAVLSLSQPHSTDVTSLSMLGRDHAFIESRTGQCHWSTRHLAQQGTPTMNGTPSSLWKETGSILKSRDDSTVHQSHGFHMKCKCANSSFGGTVVLCSTRAWTMGNSALLICESERCTGRKFLLSIRNVSCGDT